MSHGPHDAVGRSCSQIVQERAPTPYYKTCGNPPEEFRHPYSVSFLAAEPVFLVVGCGPLGLAKGKGKRKGGEKMNPKEGEGCL